ncbi:unnamed protein product [Durusdinium trenchii]|uniref:Uncharacterized protein n=2 Tax=Durusdinium trenchii TaxID=1381693 RepID=A0ABP0L3E4_9DINO
MSKKVKLGAPEEIFDLPGNKECADCTAYGPNWASWNLGILICETCAGMHRNLGTHISKVKSTTMDKWNEEQAVPCRNIGNFMSNSFYEYNLPPKTKYVTSVKSSGGDKIDTGEARKLERWIRAKYEAKKYSQPGVDPPHVRLARGESLREAPKEEKPVEEKSASKKDKEKKEKTDKGDKSPSKKDGKEKKEKVSKKEKKDLDREVTPAPAVKEVKRSRKEKKEKKSQELESSFAELETWAMTSSKEKKSRKKKKKDEAGERHTSDMA